MKSKHLEIILALALVVVVVSAFATTWTVNTSSGYPSWLAMSADGRIICAVPSYTYSTISTNWGQTWSPITNVADGHAVAVSADGSQIFFTSFTSSYYTNPAESKLLVSTNYGNTWLALLTTNSATVGISRVACSADGTKLIASIGNIYFSTNSGANWYMSSAPSNLWYSLASSADGRLMVGAPDGGSIYFSTNIGATWT